jgi:hypothetical protein
MTFDRCVFAVALALTLATLNQVIAGTSLDRALQIQWLIITVMWILLAWRNHERLNGRSK